MTILKIKVIVVLCTYYLLVGCTFTEYIGIFNNSGSAMYIILLEENAKKIVEIDDAEKRYIKISSLPLEKIEMLINNNVWIYSWNYFEMSHFIKREGFGPWSKIVYRFQIESDGLIYILRQSDQFILNDLSNQPRGYPIKPKKTREPMGSDSFEI